MGTRTRVELGRREDLGADCANCFGLCCVALAFAVSADFPFDKPAGEPCPNLDDQDACRVHAQLRTRGFKGCTVFDCFGAGQKTSRHTFAGRSWRDDDETRTAMFAAFPIIRRLHELLWYLDQAITLVEAAGRDATPWQQRFEGVRELSDLPGARVLELDVDAEYDRTRSLLIHASELARQQVPKPERSRRRQLGPQSNLMGARLARADLRGVCLRGSTLIAADLSGARLARCDLRDADLSGADLEDAIYLTQMQVNSARGDTTTRLPPGFQRPSHWLTR
ncbi:MAG: pentapeptide repeat-containing protein [Microlunatus sp.]